MRSNDLRNDVARIITFVGGSVLGYGVDIAMGGSGLIGGAAGGGCAVGARESRKYIDTMSAYIADRLRCRDGDGDLESSRVDSVFDEERE
jgi:hypothetical protein